MALTMLLVVVLLLVPAPVLGFLVRAPVVQTGRSLSTSSSSASVVPVVLPQRQRVAVRQSTVPDGSDGMPPMPMGGESEYEYESEYSDQQAVRPGRRGGGGGGGRGRTWKRRTGGKGFKTTTRNGKE